jgi:E3 ubiquitin-protein ligase MGRN1
MGNQHAQQQGNSPQRHGSGRGPHGANTANPNGEDDQLNILSPYKGYSSRRSTIDTCSCPILQNDVIIHRHSLKLEKIGDKLYDVQFNYSAHREPLITIYFMVQEVYDKSSRVTFYFNELFEGHSIAKKFKLKKGYDKKFPNKMFQLDLSPFNELKDVMFNGARDDKYALVFKCELFEGAIEDVQKPLVYDKNVYIKDFWIFCNFGQDESGEMILKIEKQKIDMNNSCFLVEEIYGGSQAILNKANAAEKRQEIDKECVVCYTSKIDTVVMSCRHMVLCNDCAKQVKEKNKKCPLCREEVKGTIHLKLKDEFLN